MFRRFSERINLYTHGCSQDFEKGECYRYGRYVKPNRNRAKFFYTKAAKNGHAEAYTKLGEFYGEDENVPQALKCYLYGAMRGSKTAGQYLIEYAGNENLTARYYLGMVFEERQNWEQAEQWYKESIGKNFVVAMHRLGKLYHDDRLAPDQHVVIQKNIATEIDWYQKGIENGCAYALNAFVELAKVETQAALLLGKMYVEGKGCITKNLGKAIDAYKQASKLDSVEAFYQVGICYEQANDIPHHLNQACFYYCEASKRKHPQSLTAMETLVARSENTALIASLAEFYYQHLNELERAAELYKKAADQGYSFASLTIQRLVNTDSEFAYLIARLYEKEDPQKSMRYYAIAMRHKHQEAATYLKELVEAATYLKELGQEENVEAMYAASEYHHHRGELLDAAKLCMQAAEQGHVLAANYLKDTSFDAENCFVIASLYEEGEEVSQNMPQAFAFYIRAGQLGHTEAAFHLGQLYQVDYPGVQRDIEKAFQYYLQAARASARQQEALVSLERLGNEVSAELQRKFGELYEVLQNHEKAKFWYQTAADVGDVLAQRRLEDYKKPYGPMRR
ncbi:MAG: tetratricopeptide repeat protein [Pseudomonadota bacterium]